MKESEMATLHERIAKALKWEVQETYHFSLAALRALLRITDPKLYAELGEVILTGDHLTLEKG